MVLNSKKTFFTSDLHLGHVNAATKFRNFSNVEDHDSFIIDNWNDTVSDDDDVIVLGDMVMGHFAESIELVKLLKGNKFLIPGNHDRIHPSYHHKNPQKREFFRSEYERVGLTILPLVDHFQCDPVENLFLSSTGLIPMCHFPMKGDHTDEDRYPEYRPFVNRGTLLHGHVHAMWKINNIMSVTHVNVGVDVWDFRPVDISDINKACFNYFREKDELFYGKDL